MRLGTCLLYESRTLQGALNKMADICAAPVADFYAAVDNLADNQSVSFDLEEGRNGKTQATNLALI
jgi:hypothetical protein